MYKKKHKSEGTHKVDLLLEQQLYSSLHIILIT